MILQVLITPGKRLLVGDLNKLLIAVPVNF